MIIIVVVMIVVFVPFVLCFGDEVADPEAHGGPGQGQLCHFGAAFLVLAAIGTVPPPRR